MTSLRTPVPADLESQADLTAEIKQLQAETRPGDAQPRLDWPPYRSSLLRHPTKTLRYADPEGAELVAPVFGQTDIGELESDLTVQPGGEPIGERIKVTGRVLDGDGRPVRGQLVEIWQANASGRYIHQRDQHPAPIDPNFTGVGRCLTDDDGWYSFTSIKPGPYPWRNHRNAWRPAHIHFSLFGTEFTQRLITQMYFPGDQLFALDPILQSITDQRARDRLVATCEHELSEHEWLLGYRWDIVLTGTHATYLEPGDE
ncbi:protocatechuate 3,4-dioxygenase beta subunit [Kribbella sp. VKM Ac-2527]|uniref:Protocatechuate 3,4-dioxygenase beta subunit n=1 Tax=Kribbella caucasensis TaxID=2512215 RepID=A0A4R6KDV1_9ACTN|nr:protocatechuate 3,4-dioxygenase subunit beta [Kribbella sp. VKM Ac-2527]TDO48427.1 protocatechuate 3,4-dioxygenase beta subunit [Kribbella sp. VKM Ac-2527]